MLRTFLAAADTGSFSGAAQRVNASPSSVTERIKQLEYRLSTKLFERDKRGCRLTAAGRRFLAPANQALRTLDLAKHEVALPDHFTQSISFGGQYALWNRALIAWLATTRKALPDIAWKVTSGASARLNRDLAEGFLDMAVLYDPVFRQDIRSQPLFQDRLILVTAGSPSDWQHDYVRIEWGRGIGSEIASRLGLAPESGLILDLGARSQDLLIAQSMAGYMPRSSVAAALASGALQQVPQTPEFDLPAYVCWRDDLDEDTARHVVASLQSANLNAPRPDSTL